MPAKKRKKPYRSAADNRRTRLDRLQREVDQDERVARSKANEAWRKRQNKKYDGLSFTYQTPDDLNAAGIKIYQAVRDLNDSFREFEKAQGAVENATFDAYQHRVI